MGPPEWGVETYLLGREEEFLKSERPGGPVNGRRAGNSKGL